MESPGGVVNGYEQGEVGSCSTVKSFVGETDTFQFYFKANGQPAK